MAKYNLDCGCGVNRKTDKRNCAGCQKTLCGRHTLYYVDESNIAITNNAKGYCRECYREVFKR